MSRRAEPTYVGAYWADRSEGAVDVAQRLRACLEQLAQVSTRCTGWRRKGPRRSQAQTPMSLEVDELAAHLATSREPESTNAVALGVRWSAWNGDDEAPVGMSVTAGAVASGVGVSNAVVLTVPPVSVAEDVYASGSELLGVLIDAWEPDWVVWTSHVLREHVGGTGARPMAGWLTYVDRAVADLETGEEFRTGRLLRASDGWAAVRESTVADLQQVIDAGVQKP